MEVHLTPTLTPDVIADLRADPAAQAAFLLRGNTQESPVGGLAAKIAEAATAGRPLRVKLGLDPTAPDLHLGHTVVLRRLREFQALGHDVVLIIGDYTARVGDPSGRSATRPQLSPAEIDAAASTYTEQVLRILDPERAEIRMNSEWLDMRMERLFELARSSTIAQLLERDDFARRFGEHEPISILELLYPLIQGYDSWAIQADVEIGGTDQTFNLHMGRHVQHHFGQARQVCLTLPILTGIDGVQKMSKSLGNAIGITETAEEIVGRTMSIPDELLPEWWAMLFDTDLADADPYRQKRALSVLLADRWAGPGAGERGLTHFDRLFKRHEAPADMPDIALNVHVAEGVVHLPALLQAAFGCSRGDARRQIGDGAVRVGGESVRDLNLPADCLRGHALQMGKRRWVRPV